jgi:hypothetical protein
MRGQALRGGDLFLVMIDSGVGGGVLGGELPALRVERGGRGRAQRVAAAADEGAAARLGLGALAAVGAFGQMSLDGGALGGRHLAVDVRRHERFEVFTIHGHSPF